MREKRNLDRKKCLTWADASRIIGVAMTGKQFRKIREELGLSRPKLAEELGIDRAQVTRYENGDVLVPKSRARAIELLKLALEKTA